MLWHVPNGPLPLHGSDDLSFVEDPWTGWTELRPGADPSLPYFGPGHPGVYRLSLRLGPDGNREHADIGMSSLSWIGNYFASIGRPASKATELHWASFRRWLEKTSTRLPRTDASDAAARPEIYAFPAALKAIEEQGATRAVDAA